MGGGEGAGVTNSRLLYPRPHVCVVSLQCWCCVPGCRRDQLFWGFVKMTRTHNNWNSILAITGHSGTLIYPPRFKRTTSKHHWVQPTEISPLSLLEMICIQSINHDTLDQWEASIQVTGSFSTNDRPVSSSLLIMFNSPGSRLLHHPFVWTE